MFSKKGQGLSLNAIIIAALALIVLVVLVAVFTGQIGKTKVGIEQAGQAKLVTMKLSYGDCHPRGSVADTFVKDYNSAEDAASQNAAEDTFKDSIDECNKLLTKDDCTNSCQWKS
jgi:hypothetical protein